MQKTYVISFGLFFRARYIGRGEGTVRKRRVEKGGRSIDFPSRETREKTVFPCITVFLHEYDIHGGDRLFFNFPFVCLSTLQIRTTITTSCCSRWLSIAELSSVKSDRVAWFFAFCFLISSCAMAATRISLYKTPDGVFSSQIFFCFPTVSVIITTSCKFIYT